ncbi:hypothetical protein K438DRAFT_1787260 [Mycena galopus ATCC 62051]|nr:hypothetical protein K438DRAFT_1787260 [Mycena galopus ATCC 62051]
MYFISATCDYGRIRNVRLAEGATAVVYGSDHGLVYMFNLQTGEHLQRLDTETGEWVQTVAQTYQTAKVDAPTRSEDGDVELCVWKRLEPEPEAMPSTFWKTIWSYLVRIIVTCCCFGFLVRNLQGLLGTTVIGVANITAEAQEVGREIIGTRANNMTAGNMLDEVRVNYYVLRERGRPLIDSRVLLIESLADVFEILRQHWGPIIKDVAEPPWDVVPPCSVVNVFSGLGFRPEAYKPDVDNYFGHWTQLNFQLLHRHRGFIALQYRGLVAHLARPETFLNDLLHNCDQGIPEFANCLWNNQSNYAYWFQGLTRSEIGLLCGVYHIVTGKTNPWKDRTIIVSLNTGGLSEQTQQISWWTTPSTWQSGGLDPGWWSPTCEDWFLRTCAAQFCPLPAAAIHTLNVDGMCRPVRCCNPCTKCALFAAASLTPNADGMRHPDISWLDFQRS